MSDPRRILRELPPSASGRDDTVWTNATVSPRRDEVDPHGLVDVRQQDGVADHAIDVERGDDVIEGVEEVRGVARLSERGRFHETTEPLRACQEPPVYDGGNSAETMTLIELLVVVVCLALGGVGSLIGGAGGGIVGSLVGLVAGVATLPVVARIGGGIDAAFFMGPDGDPPCLCGADTAPWFGDGRGRRCSCGLAFARRRGRVVELLPGGDEREILRWHWRRGWVPSTQPAAFRPYR